MQNFEYRGFWWLPKQPEKKESGVIKFDSIEGVTLELLDSKFGGGSFPILLGQTSCGKKITLYGCYITRSTSNPRGYSTATINSDVVLVGEHFQREEDIVFDSLSISYSYLNDWHGVEAFEIDGMPSFKALSLGCGIRSVPHKLEFKLKEFDICLYYEFEMGGDLIKEICLKQSPFIRVKPHSKIHFNDYHRRISYPLQNFLSLAVGKAVHPLVLKGKSEEYDEEVFVYYPIRNSSQVSRQTYLTDMLFSFQDISDDFDKYLDKWLFKYDQLRPVFNLFFGKIYNDEMYLQHEFLSLIQALESYHRLRIGGIYLLSCDYELVYDALLSAIPPVQREFKESLEHRLKYLNEFSLQRRLKEILRGCESLIDLVILDSNRFVETVVNTRNFLTHHDKDLNEKAASGWEMARLVQIMEFLIEMCFMIELEMPMTTIRKLAERRIRYAQIHKFKGMINRGE